MNTLYKILYLLSTSERKQAAILLFMILIMAILDTIGVASILPFMAILTNPDLIDTNIFLISIFDFFKKFGLEDKQQFLIALGFIVFGLLVTSLIFKAITNYFQLRFVHMRDYSIAKRLVESYLHQPFSWFLNRNSAELGKNIVSEVSLVSNSCIKPLIELIAKGTVTIALILLLIFTDPMLALIVGSIIGSFYIFVLYFFKNILKKIGNQRLLSNQLRFSILSEAFGSIKELKLRSLENKYIDQYSAAGQIFAKSQASSQIIGQLPRYVLEAVSFGGIMLLILYLIRQSGNFNNALPVISLYVFAGYRLMPAVQQIYASFTNLTFINSALDRLYFDLKSLEKKNYTSFNKSDFSFKKSIALRNICFTYPKSHRQALYDINLIIPAKSNVGFIGTTGSGKTTTIDVILGLLEPQKGTLEIDDQVITNQNLRSWQGLIGYVPQQIYLSDDTIAGNIAFGVDKKEIDYDRVKNISKIANLHDFIIEELPYQYQTKIGERGIRLSGGQRQRIGIARSLYHRPKLLIFDEATNALDNKTEQQVIDSISNISKEITVIMIAHRLNTIKNCDIIFKFQDGRVVDQGKFDKVTIGMNEYINTSQK